MAFAWSIQGWEPWNMWINQLALRRVPPREERSSIQRAATTFFRRPRIMLLHGFLIAAGAPIPWLISGVSRVFDGQPLRSWREPIPWWGMVILEIMEAIRGRAIALFVLAGKLRDSWPNLVTNTNGEA
jgi:hypothetical protein